MAIEVVGPREIMKPGQASCVRPQQGCRRSGSRHNGFPGAVGPYGPRSLHREATRTPPEGLNAAHRRSATRMADCGAPGAGGPGRAGARVLCGWRAVATGCSAPVPGTEPLRVGRGIRCAQVSFALASWGDVKPSASRLSLGDGQGTWRGHKDPQGSASIEQDQRRAPHLIGKNVKGRTKMQRPSRSPKDS